jgi:hypothetical protein
MIITILLILFIWSQKNKELEGDDFTHLTSTKRGRKVI